MSETTSAVEVTASAIAGKVTTATGTGVTLLSWATSLDWGFWIGVCIGLAGLVISFCSFLINLRYQKKKDQREDEIHQLTVKKLQGECHVKQD